MIVKYYELTFAGKEITPQEIENHLTVMGVDVQVCEIQILEVIEVDENNIPKKENLN